MKTKFSSPKRWLAAPALAIAAACVLFAQPVLAQTRSALVQSVDEPGRNPYQELRNFNCRVRVICEFEFAPVPAGKRLVLTHISGHADTLNGTLPYAYVGSIHGVVVPPLGTATTAGLPFAGVRGPTSSVVAFGTRIIFNQSVQAYFDHGVTPNGRYSLYEYGDTFTGVATLMLTGYFVNVP